MARVDPPDAASELDMLLAFLDYQRETMIWKLEGLSEEQARSVHSPKGNSIGGMVRHLAYVERNWFRGVFRGEQDLEVPWTKEDPDADFRLPDDMTVQDVIDFYRTSYADSNEIARAAGSLDDRAVVEREGVRVTLRWILCHMIEETARHAGHADISREIIDGSVGE
jgi:uncharacterized damage-inducible protein DinB